MAKTISEKILSARSGVDAYAGQIVEAEIDYVMANDVTAPLAFREFEGLECEPVRDKIVLIPDHFVPNKDIASAEQAAEMRRFVQKWKLPNYFEVGRGGVCHQVMVDEGFAASSWARTRTPARMGASMPSPPASAPPRRLRASPRAACGSRSPRPST